MTESEKERRHLTRIPFDVDYRISGDSEQALYCGHVIDLSLKGALIERFYENIEAPNAPLKVDRLLELGVDTLICGAISEWMQQEFAARDLARST